MVHSLLLGREVSNYSEEWRHETECRWLINTFPTRQEKHLYLYGVTDRATLFTRNSERELVLREDHKKLWRKDDNNRTIKPLMGHRSLEEADRILADAKRLYEMKNENR